MHFGGLPRSVGALSRDDLVDAVQIAALLTVNEHRVEELSTRADFPPPVERVRSGRTWRRRDIESWARDTGLV
jgi:hypothetical protein